LKENKEGREDILRSILPPSILKLDSTSNGGEDEGPLYIWSSLLILNQENREDIMYRLQIVGE